MTLQIRGQGFPAIRDRFVLVVTLMNLVYDVTLTEPLQDFKQIHKRTHTG